MLALAVTNAVTFMGIAEVDPAHVDAFGHPDPINDRDWLKAWFFTLQTMRTTGYGVGFSLNTDLMWLGSVFMALGTIVWSFVTAQLAAFAVVRLKNS